MITSSKKVYKSFKVLPEPVQQKLCMLIKQLALDGPIAHNWPNYSKLGKNKYHCQLNYHYVVCWVCDDNSIQIEVYYAVPQGRDENAPY